MKMTKIDVLLAIGLVVLFTVLSTSRSPSLIARRDLAWLLVALVGVCFYTFATNKRGAIPFPLAITKLQLIFLACELLAFAIYLIKSKAIQHGDAVAWLYFYPYVLWTAILVFCAYPACFWLFKRT